MNILVIGNGFDLAHGLPTKYTDFLDYCKMIKQLYIADTIRSSYDVWEEVKIPNSDKNKNLRIMFENMFKDKKEWDEIREYPVCIERPYKIYDEFYMDIGNNTWIDYFLQNPMYKKENWIDFESEISNVIQSLDNDLHRLSGDCTIDDDIDIKDLSNEFLHQIYSNYIYEKITFREIRNRLLNDLNKLIRALEIYLTEYVGNIEIQKKSPDIEALKIDHVLSFNYTNMFSKLYKIIERIGDTNSDILDYIHGYADINNTVESNNMVLGIDEYRPFAYISG